MLEKKSPTEKSGGVSRPTCFEQAIGLLLIACNVAVRIYSALYMIISDCDETFNYWEALHFVARGFGKQTWEYSPLYAIRSFAYIVPHYIVTFAMRDYFHLTGFEEKPYAFFYFLRVTALCGFTAFAEYKLYRSATRNFGGSVGNWFLLFSTFSAGMSHAGVAFLPSSFAMNCCTIASSFALDAIESTSVVASSLFAFAWFLTAGLLGWPFALALGVPFGAYTLVRWYQTTPLAFIVLFSTLSLVAISTYVIATDLFFYDRTLLFVPLNIVLYNVFALEGEGPEIFGVEPFSYYVKNLLLNFNVVFLAGLGGAIIGLNKQNLKTTFGVSAPLMMWLFIFGRQPHKEERFLYPIYPLLTLSASLFVEKSFAVTQCILKRRSLVRVIKVTAALLVSAVSVLRILSLVENYSAPLTTAVHFADLRSGSDPSQTYNVCVGREWYHFPTSFFLPANHRLRFVKSGFDGLLPGDFPEGVSLKEAIRQVPEGMNPKNQFYEGTVVPLSQCHFFIDNTSPVNEAVGEQTMVSVVDGETVAAPGWELLTCGTIIDPSVPTGGLGHILFVPREFRGYFGQPAPQMDYCYLARSD